MENSNTLIQVKEETVGSRMIDTASYSVPVMTFVYLVVEILLRFYPDFGIRLIFIIGAASGVVFNALYSLLRFLIALAKQKYKIDN